MADFATILFSLLGALIGASLGPYLTHKLSVRYLKKKYFFQEKIILFEKIGAITWKNHLALTTIEQANNMGIKDSFDIIKGQLKLNIYDVAEVMNKLIYISDDLRINLGTYVSLFEEYLNDKEFGKLERTKKLREDYKGFIKNINKIIEKEINKIK